MLDTSNWITTEVLIDTPEYGTYPCHLDPDKRWNGWRCPCFTFDEAWAVMENYENINPDERMSYDEDERCFIIADGGGPLESYYPVEADDGEEYWLIGYGSWCWLCLEDL